MCRNRRRWRRPAAAPFARAFRPARNGRRPRRGRSTAPPGSGERTKDLVKRLGSSDVAVIDHRNLDRIAAEELVASGVRAVINVVALLGRQLPERRAADPRPRGRPADRRPGPASSSTSSRTATRWCSTAGASARRGEVVAEGRLLEADELARDLDEQRRRIDQGPARLHREHDGPHPRGGRAALGHDRLPRDAHRASATATCLIVVRGTDHIKDLRALRAYIRDVQPGPGRRRRRRRRDPQGGPEARHHPRRHGLGPRGDAALRGRADRPRLPRRQRAGRRAAAGARASTTWSSRRPAPARTWRCCSPPRRARR